MHNILIVDDEPTIRQSLKGVLEDEGFKTSLAESGEAGLESISKNTFDVVLLDVWLPGIDGLETLEKIREKENAPEVIMISGHGTIETAVRATKLGAYDFLEKPLSIDKTLILIKNAIDAKRLREENRELKKQLVPKSVIVGDSIPDEGTAPANSDYGSDQWPCSHFRRVGHGQRISGPRHSRAKLAQGRDVCRGELRRHSRGFD